MAWDSDAVLSLDEIGWQSLPNVQRGVRVKFLESFLGRFTGDSAEGRTYQVHPRVQALRH